MKGVIGIISSTCRSDVLMKLTKVRPIAAVPFGGRYRLIDFALSNMVNTGLRTVGIVTPHNYRPVLDHLRSGKDWFLDRKTGGLFILPSAENRADAPDTTFLLKDLFHNMDYLKKAREEYVLISCCGIVMNINYKKALSFHENNDNDITLIYKEETIDPGESGDLLFIDQEEDGRVKAIRKDMPTNQDNRGKSLLNIIIIKRELLINILEEHGKEEGANFFGVLAQKLEGLKVYGFEFQGYVGRITSLRGYFEHSMDLLKPEVRSELFTQKDRIHTKITDNPPSKYGKDAVIENSLVGSGCKIEGHVENSILFREAEIKPGARIKNSIIMQKNIIGRDVTLENVILDKFVIIKDGTIIKGKKDNPMTIDKAAIIGPKEVSCE